MKNLYFLDFANMNVLEYYFRDAEGSHLVLKNGLELLGDLDEEAFNILHEGMPIAYYEDEAGSISFWLLEEDWQSKTTCLFENEELEAELKDYEFTPVPGNLIYVREADVETVKSYEKLSIGVEILTESGKKLLCRNLYGMEIVPGVTKVVCKPHCQSGEFCAVPPKEVFTDEPYFLSPEYVLEALKR